jgi:hypothetical protein
VLWSEVATPGTVSAPKSDNADTQIVHVRQRPRTFAALSGAVFTLEVLNLLLALL